MYFYVQYRNYEGINSKVTFSILEKRVGEPTPKHNIKLSKTDF